jgi:hypothetical protein
MIVIDSDCVAFVPVPSVAIKITVVGPVVVMGVPDMTPLELIVSPIGNVPEAIVQV